MAETHRAKIHTYCCWWHQIFSATLVGEETEHEILKQAARVRESDVGAVGGVGGLLQEHAVAGYFADVDGDGEALALENFGISIELTASRWEVVYPRGELTSEDGVHDWYVLVRQIAGDGED